ncbi:MAG TPA: hypothetical protein VET65_11370 [Candidatus Limnocylindrales bacterium]|nr:hypothetical protein [Candidatus Limnocylindrales bacterium]
MGARGEGFPWWVRVLRHLGHAGGGRATGAMRVWLAWEAFWVPRLRAVRPGSLVRYALGTHHGRPVRLQDGVLVSRGDRLLELHMDNRTLLRLASSGFDPFAADRLGSGELHELATAIRSGALGPVRALHAVTPFAPALRRQDFEVRPVPHTVAFWFTRLYMTGLFALYHPSGWAALTPHRARRWPSEVWMSRERFLQRMSATAPPAVPAP